MGKPINGSDLMLFIDSTGEGTAFKSIAFATRSQFINFC